MPNFQGAISVFRFFFVFSFFCLVSLDRKILDLLSMHIRVFSKSQLGLEGSHERKNGNFQLHSRLNVIKLNKYRLHLLDQSFALHRHP